MSELDNIFYAVRVGRHPGVYRSRCVVLRTVPLASIREWYVTYHREQCLTQVFKYPNAEHESFATEQQAWAYIRGDGMTSVSLNSPFAIARTDSFTAVNLSANSGKKGKSRSASTGEPPIAQGWTVVYTDGACSDNQDAAKARAGVGVWWAEDDPR
jgi:hypothetical protein